MIAAAESVSFTSKPPDGAKTNSENCTKLGFVFFFSHKKHTKFRSNLRGQSLRRAETRAAELNYRRNFFSQRAGNSRTISVPTSLFTAPWHRSPRAVEPPVSDAAAVSSRGHRFAPNLFTGRWGGWLVGRRGYVEGPANPIRPVGVTHLGSFEDCSYLRRWSRT